MKYFKPAALCALLWIGFALQAVGQHKIHALKIKDINTLQAFFKYKEQQKPIISGHRGGMVKGFPENSIATFENTLRYTPAFFEVDPRLTKDSVVVLMHDATLNRTTNGTGKVADYTYAELQKLYLKDLEGNITPFQIPTLAEALKWSAGKTVLNLDKKDVPLPLLERILSENPNKVVMITVHNAKQAKYYYDLNPNRMFSAFIKTKEALLEYEAAGIPMKTMIAYIGSVNKPENKEILDLLHARGIKCMISAAPVYDKLKSSTERAESYRSIFKEGIDILESDFPIEVAAAIKP